MVRRILKWQVPVDDHDHPIGSGRVVHVGSQHGDFRAVQVWTDEPDSENVTVRSARVYGTGQPLPEDDEHVGSVVVENGALVWHVLASERPTGLRSV